MATTSSGRSSGRSWQSKITCRYFVHGLCKAGNTCNYAHDRSSVIDNVCKYYKEGRCNYGDKCKFSHENPVPQVKPTKQVTAPKKGKGAPLQVQSSNKGPTRRLTPLKPGGKSKPVQFPESNFNFENVLDVPEFVPGQRYKGSAKVPSSYSSAAKKGSPAADAASSVGGDGGISTKDILCPFAFKGTCRYGENCSYTHGIVCEFCNYACLHPFETEQNEKHIEECIREHEKSMQESFALQRSAGVACSICMEVVLEKTNVNEQKFGILNNCTHPFCLDCIRKWRASRECEKTVVRACPVCRVPSNFVCPSDFWVTEEAEKKELITKYKDTLSKKPCKYFAEGSGDCPFGINCFYKHAYADGTLQDRSKAVRKYGNGDGKLKTHNPISLWDFLDERDFSDDDDFFLYGQGWEDWEDGDDLEDFLFYRTLFAGSDSDDDSVEDLVLGINMLGLTLVGAADSSLSRERRRGSNQLGETSQSHNREAIDGNNDFDDS